VKRTSSHLADGREIIYFDPDDAESREIIDARKLPSVTSNSELRYDFLLDEWVGIAGQRQERTFLPATDECPLCPSREGRLTEIPSSDYRVVVFENRFPAFSMNAPDTGPFVDEATTMFARRPAVGRCEVVCFSSDHTKSLADLSTSEMRLVLDAWVDRTAVLSQLPEVAQVFVFENRGEEIGVTLGHPHGQVYAYPYITPRTRRMLIAARNHHERTGRNLFDDLLVAEQLGPRVIERTEHWTAFVPAAARWPFEIHLFPHRRIPNLTALTHAELDDFADLYPRILRALDGVYDVHMPYIAAWHQGPCHFIDSADSALAALHLQLFSIRRAPGKLKYLAGSESAMDAFVNDVPPEFAAQLIRKAML
jgi:UDPglucose--hexose-1-phosphate uridylyltransferase